MLHDGKLNFLVHPTNILNKGECCECIRYMGNKDGWLCYLKEGDEESRQKEGDKVALYALRQP